MDRLQIYSGFLMLLFCVLPITKTEK